MATKIPSVPKSIEAEQAFLGSLIMDATAWEKVTDKIDVNDFYDANNKVIFRELLNLALSNQSIDILVLEEALKTKSVLDKIGGVEYLKDLVKKLPTSAHIETYAGIIKEKSLMRKLISSSTNIIEQVHQSEEGNVKDILDKAETEIFGITTDTKTNDGLVKIGPIVNQLIDVIYDKKNNNKIDYLLTGFKKVDERLGGLQKSDLIVIAGRPSMGKTAFSMNIAQDIVFKQNKKVGFFSLEMSAQQIATRMLSSLSGVSQQKIRTGDYESSTSDTKAVTSAIEMMQECDFFVDETPSITPMDLRGKARRMKREHGVDMIIVDYLQLMGVTRTRNFDQNRVNEISEITRSLKALAKELDIPVVALSQLNRRVEERNDKRPFLSDLRESGSIEQDADIVIFLYRDDQYNPSSENKNVAEVNISKHRNGPVGLEQLTFIPHCTRFEDYYPQVFEDTNDFGN
ncbi:MAG: replicative DNA helicase [Gammaproteobacteria bacterium]|nr:replicative DNA helicase [Gammaproteobacteria bacterium]